MKVSIISGATGWGLAVAAFSNPSYLNAPLGVTGASTGFEIDAGAALTISFEGTYAGVTAAHEQTLDPSGAAGWFSVSGSPNNGDPATSVGATSGAAYVFSTVGVRHRIKLTAMASGTITVRVGLFTEATGGVSGGGGGGGGLNEAIASAAAPAYAEGASEPRSQDLHGSARALILDSDGNALDYDDPVAVTQSGSWNLTNIDGTITLPTGAATAAKQPALGTAGTASADVLSVQGRAGMTPVVTTPLPATPVSGLTSAMTGTTSTLVTGMGTPGGSTRNYITQITIGNSHATVGTFVEFQDGNGGTTFYTAPAAAVYGGATLSFPTPLKQPTAATALYVKNTTTGANVIVSVSGYQA